MKIPLACFCVFDITHQSGRGFDARGVGGNRGRPNSRGTTLPRGHGPSLLWPRPGRMLPSSGTPLPLRGRGGGRFSNRVCGSPRFTTFRDHPRQRPENGGRGDRRGSASSRRATPSQSMLEAINSNLGLQSKADSSRVWARRARGARCAEQTCRGARTALRLHTLHLHRACSWWSPIDQRATIRMMLHPTYQSPS